MPVKTLFECEICSHQSQERKEIEACEAQGNQHLYPVDTPIEFRLSMKGDWWCGVVTEVSFEAKSHKPIYKVWVNDPDERQRMNLHPGIEHVTSLEEDNLRTPQDELATV